MKSITVCLMATLVANTFSLEVNFVFDVNELKHVQEIPLGKDGMKEEGQKSAGGIDITDHVLLKDKMASADVTLNQGNLVNSGAAVQAGVDESKNLVATGEGQVKAQGDAGSVLGGSETALGGTGTAATGTLQANLDKAGAVIKATDAALGTVSGSVASALKM